MSKSKQQRAAHTPFLPDTHVILKSDGRRGQVVHSDWLDVASPILVAFDDGSDKRCNESELLIEDYVQKTAGEYVEKLEPIYREVLNAFWSFNPSGRPDWGVSAQSLYAMLSDKHTLGEVREACEQLVGGKAMTVEDGIFYRLTPLGDAILYHLQEQNASRSTVPPFSPPPGV